MASGISQTDLQLCQRQLELGCHETKFLFLKRFTIKTRPLVIDVLMKAISHTPRSNSIIAIIAALLLIPAVASNAADANGECYFSVSGRIPSGWKYSIEVQNSWGSWQNISYGYSSSIPDSFYASDVRNWKNKNVNCRYTIWPSGGSPQTPITFIHPAGQRNYNLSIVRETPKPTPTPTPTLTPTPNATVTTLAGAGSAGYGDGTATGAIFSAPSGAAIDTLGNIYIADTANNRIRKVTPSGVVSTLAGSGTKGFSDGQGVVSQFNSPMGVAVDANFNIYVADSGNNRIRKITPSGAVTTIAGSGSAGYKDGQKGSETQFSGPTGVVVDASGNLIVTDYYNNRIRKITWTTTLPSQLYSSGWVDGTFSSSERELATVSINGALIDSITGEGIGSGKVQYYEKWASIFWRFRFVYVDGTTSTTTQRSQIASGTQTQIEANPFPSKPVKNVIVLGYRTHGCDVPSYQYSLYMSMASRLQVSLNSWIKYR